MSEQRQLSVTGPGGTQPAEATIATELLVCVQGARPDVHPSGMSSQMSGGRFAYRLHPGRRSTRDDLVDIFDPADCADVATVSGQREAVDRFYDG